MKINMHKKVSILLLSLILALFTVNVYAEDTEYDYAQAEAVLTSIGILDDNSEGVLNTRAGFVKHVLRLINSEAAENKNAESVFTDVKSDVSALNSAYTLGLINGDDGTVFRPDDVIKSGEAAVIMVRALGYGVLLNSDDDYYLQAGKLELFDKTRVGTKDAELCYEQAVLMMYNFLESEVLATNLNNRYFKGEKAMTYFLDIYKEKGVVQADENTSVTKGANVGSGRVMIDGSLYEAGKVNVSEYLGMSVEFYYRDTGDEYVCLYAEAYKNEILTIESSDIVDVGADFKITYDVGERTKTVDMNASEDISIVYNGKRCINLGYEDLKLECGSLKFIDNNNDGKYDVLFVDDYATYIVKGVNAENNTVVDYVSLKMIDFGKFDKCVMADDGSEFDISRLNEYDVLHVAASKDCEYAKVIVISDKVNGEVKSVDDDEIQVGNSVYELSDFWKNRAGNNGFEIKLDSANKLLLNRNGEICYNIMSLSSSRYGVVCRVNYDDIEDCIYIKIFDREEEMLYLEGAEKLKIDGSAYKKNERYLKMSEIMTDNSYYGVVPVVYSLDGEGKLNSLITPAGSEFKVLVNNEKRYYSQDAQIWLRGTQSIDSPLYGDFSSGSSTFYCWIPTDTTQYDSYTVNSHQNLGSVEYRPVTALTLGDGRIADFVLIQEDVSGVVSAVGETENLAVVRKALTGINEDDEPVDVLHLFKNGKEIELKSKKQGDFAGVKKGDVIFYSLNAKGECVGISETYHKGDWKIYMNPVNSKGRYSGRVVYKEGAVLGVNVDDTNGTIYSNLYNSPNIYVVDDSGSVTNGTLDDIHDYATYGLHASEVFIQTNYSKVTNVVVYND